eukprot:8071723-Prorocentrum_lima.AAC.1
MHGRRSLLLPPPPNKQFNEEQLKIISFNAGCRHRLRALLCATGASVVLAQEIAIDADEMGAFVASLVGWRG